MDETDTPVACYTLPGTANAKYIWELETAEANDYLQFDSNAAYTITANKSGLVHSFIQSQKYNEPGDLTLHRTDEGSKAIHLTITPVSNKKNYFMLRDKESNLCITPSETTEAGDEWTFSEDGEVYLERISENVYFMSGENGAMANAYGDDNETNGYKVAHYGVASQWIITIAGRPSRQKYLHSFIVFRNRRKQRKPSTGCCRCLCSHDKRCRMACNRR